LTDILLAVVENERFDGRFYERNRQMAADADPQYRGKASPVNNSELRSSEIQGKTNEPNVQRGSV
jgi:hypothetical protein